MNCDDFRAHLHEYFAEELPALEAVGIDEHAAHCQACGSLMSLARELSCRQLVEFLHQYLDGELGEEEMAVFDRHLAICPDCTAYLDSYRKTMKLSAAALLSGRVTQPAEPLPEGLVRAILEASRKDRR
ncbi:MAG: zf-HC2 domain-containing protein [Planctomycetota bacterium]